MSLITKLIATIFVFQFPAIISCTNKKIENNSYSKTLFKKITFTTGRCFGSCPETAGYIDDRLNFYFYGGINSKKDSLIEGYYKSKITDTLWYEINTKTTGLRKYLDSTWEINVDGWPIEINFTDTLSHNKKIIGEPTAMPDSIYLFVEWLHQLSRKLPFEKITDSMFYQATNIKRESFRIPPPPPIKIIKFTPPKKGKH